MDDVSKFSQLARLKIFHNGTKQPLTFSASEFRRRLGELRETMIAHDLDAVILTSYHNVKYFSDFLYTAFGRSYALVVTQQGTVLVTANIDAGMPWRTSYGENIVYTDWQRDNFYHAVRQTLKQQHRTAQRIGIEEDTVSVRQRKALDETFEAADLVDVSAVLMRQRMIKSAEEIQLIKHGARIADLGGEAIRAVIGQGASEYEVALVGQQAMIHEIARMFPQQEIRDTWVWFQSGINTDGAHNWPTTRKLQRGDLLSMNCFPMISGYYTALERTMTLGQPDERTLELWQINVAVHRAGLELIQPGAVCQDIAHQLNELYIQHGLLTNRTFGYGHSFGVLSHYYGREAGLELREDVDTVLEPGMVVSMEPMITVMQGQPGAGGYREHDILVVGDDSTENITGFPYGPEHNIIDA